MLQGRGKVTTTMMTNHQRARFQIPTGCLKLDELLEGGIESNKITEVYGKSGSGKTQFAIEIMLNTIFSEVNGNVIYVSTKNCLTPDHITSKIERYLKVKNSTIKYARYKITLQKILTRIMYKRVVNLYDLIFAIYQAREATDRAYYRFESYKLIIIDSLTYFLRDQRPSERQRICHELFTVLENTAINFVSKIHSFNLISINYFFLI